jgi:uncharacterized membrane protein
MEELDLLKKAWKKDSHSYEQVSENEIYKMIHKRSSSIVKWILIISIIEFVFWNIISLGFLDEKYIKDKYGKDIFEYVIEINTIFNIISYIVVIIFIYLFYKNYKSISTTNSTKKLMSDILKTRKTVQCYVWFNIIFFVVGTLILLYVQFAYDSRYESYIEKIHQDGTHMLLYKAIGRITGLILLIVLIFWLFYRLLYGILLRRLNANYKELKKIDL